MTSPEERKKILDSIKSNQAVPVKINTAKLHLPAKYAQIRLKPEIYALINGIDRCTYYRWKKIEADRRKGANHANFKRFDNNFKKRVLKALKLYPDLDPRALVALYEYEKGEYLGSVSTIYRIMHEYNLTNAFRHGGGKGARHNFNRDLIKATAPKQVFCWDITYLYRSVKGEYYYLYSALDLYSRKIVHHEVHYQQSDAIAASFLEHTLEREHIAITGHLKPEQIGSGDITVQGGLILHSDNGAPMTGKIMRAKMEELGVQSSYSRPHHSNDNAFIESSFATLKHSHVMPIPKSFNSLKDAQEWVDKFYNWYNTEHKHSGICYLTPEQCHSGRGDELLQKANAVRDAASAKLGFRKPLKHRSLPKEVSLNSFYRVTHKKLAQKAREEEYANKNKEVA